MLCEDTYNAMVDAEERYGTEDDRYWAAFWEYQECMEPIRAGRQAHAEAWEERMREHQEFLREYWEALVGRVVPPPGPRPDPDARFVKLENQIFADAKTAMIFSESIERAFQESGIQLGENETFACVVYVREKPASVSEAIPATSLNVIMAPSVMKQVMPVIEQMKHP